MTQPIGRNDPPGLQGWVVTVDEAPSNDPSREIGHTARIWKDGRLIAFTGSQSYANAADLERILRDMFESETVLLLNRTKDTEAVEVLRSGIGPLR